MKIESVAVDKLVLDPANARKHSEANLDAIAGSLREFGQRKPIVVTASGVVVAGNGTLEAARSLGWERVDVVRVPGDWSADQVKAFALADNRTAELAEWNPKVLSAQLLELQESGFEINLYGFEQVEKPNDDDWNDVLGSLGGEREPVQQMTFTLHDDQVETVKMALQVAKNMGEFVDTGNPNGNGNALARIAEFFMGDHS